MKINTALILCAGFGKRLNPLTLSKPKPLIEVNKTTMLENCINLILKLGIKKILLNTHYLSEQINDFIKTKNYSIDIQIIEDGINILNTGGGILNMIKHTQDEDFLIFNPDTLWNTVYHSEINKMQNYYFKNNLNNLLLVVKKDLSFDEKLKGDFNLKNNFLKRDDQNNFIYIGCQILNKNLFKNHKLENFSVSDIWDELLKDEKLNGFQSLNKFYHLTNLEILKKLEDS